MNIFLDDIRFPYMSHNIDRGLGSDYSDSDNWVIIRDYGEFTKIVRNNFNDINIISLDHDLACFHNNREYTGKDCVDFLINYCLDNNLKFPSWYVHSSNPSGRENMISAILNYLKVIEGKDISKFRYFNNGIIDNVIV